MPYSRRQLFHCQSLLRNRQQTVRFWRAYNCLNKNRISKSLALSAGIVKIRLSMKLRILFLFLFICYKRDTKEMLEEETCCIFP